VGYINIIVHGFFWFLGFLILWKIPVCQKVPVAIDGADSGRILSVIIPARNEEKNLPQLLGSLKEQTVLPYEVIVVDDDSTDSTAGVARDLGAKVISLKGLPRGWVGKSWACYNGARQSGGNYLLFLDADTSLREDGIERIIGCIIENKGVVSIQPYHVVKRLYENLSLFFNIILIAGMGAFTPLQKILRPIGAFGPCLICSRSDYFHIGGHESIKGKVMEDIEIGKKFLKSKIPLHCMGGKDTIDFRMYPGGIADVVKGWSKSFSTGARSTSIPVLIMVIAWIAGAIFPLNALVEGLRSMDIVLILLAAGFYAAFALQIYWMSFRIGNFNPLASILYPIPLAFFVIIFLYSFVLTFFRRRVTWKDRKIRT